MSRAPTLSVGLPNYGSWVGPDWQRLLDVARAAEDAGVDRVVVVDHVVIGRHTEEYAWGRFPGPPEGPWLEPLTVLTAIATATSTVRLGTGILIAPLRPAPLLAKIVATLDVLSGGRLDLGVGVGWQREEYDAAGLDFSERGQLLTDTIGACRVLWQEQPATFSSATKSFTDIFCSPLPMQERLPVWFSGTLHDLTYRRIVDLGDGWIPIMGATVDDIRAGAQRLRAGAPRAIEVQAPATFVRGPDKVPDLVATMASVPRLVAAGATDIHVTLQYFCRTPDDAQQVLADIVKEFRSVC